MLPSKLITLLQMAYSAEKTAAFAYQGHAASVKPPALKAAIRQIEMDEWEHREEVLQLMNKYGILPSKWFEFKYHVIGKFISWSCSIIGWFMPIYFAGRLESGNVIEYFNARDYFNEIGITEHDDILVEMGIKEKEHEVYFGNLINRHWLLPLFKFIFRWGPPDMSFNDVQLEDGRMDRLEKKDKIAVTSDRTKII